MESYRYLGDGLYNILITVSDIANDFLQACVIIHLKDEADEVLYVNEYGKLVFGDLLGYTSYWLGLFGLSYTQEHGKYSLTHGTESRARDASGNPLHSPVSRWMSSSSSWKGDLQYRYEAIMAYHTKCSSNRISFSLISNRYRLQPPPLQSNDSVIGPHYQKALYMLGSILCDLQHLSSPRRVLVGRARPWPHGWKWDISWHIGSPMKVVNPSFDKFVIQSTNF